MVVKQSSKDNPVIFTTVEKFPFFLCYPTCAAKVVQHPSYLFNNCILNYGYLSNSLKPVAADL